MKCLYWCCPLVYLDPVRTRGCEDTQQTSGTIRKFSSAATCLVSSSCWFNREKLKEKGGATSTSNILKLEQTHVSPETWSEYRS